MRMDGILTVVLLAMAVVACEAPEPDGRTNAVEGDRVASIADVPPPIRGYVMARWHDEIPHTETDVPMSMTVVRSKG